MTSSNVEIASYQFETTKEGRSFIFEMKLLRSEAGEYCFLRRHYYASFNAHQAWRHSGWHSETEKKKFNMKVVQKRDILKYNLVHAIDKQ